MFLHLSNLCRAIPAGSQAVRRGWNGALATQRFKSAATFDRMDTPIENQHHARPKLPDFSDAQAAYSSKTTAQLLRAALVYNLCNITPLVQNAEVLLRTSRKLFGDFLVDSLLKATLFGHFCAGEDEDRIKPVLEDLKSHGIGGILDYAAESDTVPQPASHSNVYKLPNTKEYDYESEAACDEHVEVFRSCIRSVHKVAPDGFAAVKVTALGNPKLLERMSTAIVEAGRLFTRFDGNGDGVVTTEEFQQGYAQFFNYNDQDLEQLVKYLDYDNSGHVDYITWSKLLRPSDLPKITANCRAVGPLARATPTDEELELIEVMFRRAHTIAEEAAQCGTRVLIDAEQVRFQPAIDNLVLELQQKYNAVEATDVPIIFNTYQCYRKGELDEIKTDVERSERYNYHFGAKLVRGAYMESERALAERLQYPSPINDTIEDTHQCYNDAVDFLLRHSIKTDKKLEVMCATHNQESIEKALHIMDELGIMKQDGKVRFGQLFGMSDNLTFNLGGAGYKAYKYVPYGQVKQVMPYLMRRAQENSALMGNANRELKLLKEELLRRFNPVSAV
ncbi:Converts proline to delta-1-pyrroline-5-carboxylate [Fragilaria crotonensis]|nr:Converts proline to delta-1-pyrroline-5-carboxylate [Fragilaria crotonensis]